MLDRAHRRIDFLNLNFEIGLNLVNRGSKEASALTCNNARSIAFYLIVVQSSISQPEKKTDRGRLYEIVPQFVDERPDLKEGGVIQDGVIYIDVKGRFMIHNCPCGCRRAVMMSLSSVEAGGWIMQTDGAHVSLYPSIGNYAFDCKSHYFIVNNKIKWCDY